jgi:hypothetical protein
MNDVAHRRGSRRLLLFIAKYITLGSMKRIWLFLPAVALTCCSRSNNLFLGRVEASAGLHKVVVTDCYRTSVPSPEQLPNATWHYVPCRDAEIWIRRDQLEVNGRSYGRIGASDTILVDHGVVSVSKE